MDDNLPDADLFAITRGRCPRCKSRGFVIGPQGGAATNIECASLDCRRRYNVVFFGGRCLMAQVIPSEADGGSEWPSKPSDPLARHSGTFS